MAGHAPARPADGASLPAHRDHSDEIAERMKQGEGGRLPCRHRLRGQHLFPAGAAGDAFGYL